MENLPYFANLSKDKPVMEKIKDHSQERSQKIQALVKQHERDLSYGRSL